MHMKKLHALEEALACLIEAQMGHLEDLDAKELGEVVDIIKDCEEAKYYKAVVDAMEEANSYLDFESTPRMHYKGDTHHHEAAKDGEYHETEMPHTFHDGREGRSYRSRRMYMEAKQTR